MAATLAIQPGWDLGVRCAAVQLPGLGATGWVCAGSVLQSTTWLVLGVALKMSCMGYRGQTHSTALLSTLLTWDEASGAGTTCGILGSSSSMV